MRPALTAAPLLLLCARAFAGAPEPTAPATSAPDATASPDAGPAAPTETPAPATAAAPDGGPAPAAPAPQPPAPDETFTPILVPPGEAPPLPFPVVLSVGRVLNPRVSVADFYFDPHVRLRLRGAWVQQDPNVYFVGRNSGFNMAMARVGVSGGFRRTIRFNLSLEGAADTRSGSNQLVGELSTRVRDAYFTFAPWEFLQVTAGHFRPPSDRESLSSFDAASGTGRAGTPQLLPEMSVATRGVYAGEGLQVRGMDPGRDLGVMLHGDIRPLPFVGGTYALAVVNGNGQNQVLNDNNQPTVWSRITFGLRNLPVLTQADVGASVHYGRTSNIAALPNTFDDEALGSAVDGVVQLFGFQVTGQFHWVHTRHLTTRAPTELALGGFAQVAWRDLFGFSPVARVAYFQPSSALPQFTVVEVTGGMRYDVPGLPLTAQIGFTHPEETGWGVYDLGAANTTREKRVPGARIPEPVRHTVGVNNWSLDRADAYPITNERVEAVLQMSF
ncbi:MAG: hypothetical protein HY904_00050 [Deltaproteobacteria bacterium]|nr:hypothetical protein [Deltaproteobacteria bacterium]